MTIRIDASLGSAARGPAPGPLGGTEPPVVLVGPARTAPFLLEGTRVAVVGDERSGDQSLWIDERLVLSGLSTDGGPGVNVVVAPASLRREILGTASLLEHALALPTLPLAAFQWAPAPGSAGAGALAVAFTVLPGATSLRYHLSEGGLRVGPDDDGRWIVDVQVHPLPSGWSVAPHPEGGVAVQAAFQGPAPVTLLVAGGPHPSDARALAAAAHLSAHETRAAAEADPRRGEGLAVATGVPDVDHALVWASGRVRHALHRMTTMPAGEAFWMGLGALAVGDDEGARSALALLEGAGPDPVDWPLDGRVRPGTLATLLAARYTLVTGDPGPARDAHARFVGSASEVGQASDAREWRGRALALTTLADALRHAAPEEDIRRLREAAERSPIRGPVRLPMAGAGPSAHPVSLHHLLGRSSPPPTLLPLEGGNEAVACWAQWMAGDAETTWAGWRRLLGSGMTALGGSRGCWDPVRRPPGGAPQAALLLCGLAYGLLGLSPDAPSGRLGVAPSLPRHVAAFEARNLRVGAARLTLRYQRDGTTHRFALEPTRGAVPPMIVLEPSLPCSTVAGVRVDGAPADIDVTPSAGRSHLRVQLPLDGNRTLEVEEGVQ